MKKTILLLLAVLFVIGESRAQTHNIDSIKTLLKKEKRDTGKVTLLNALSMEYVGYKPDSTMRLGMDALTLAQKIHFDKGVAASLNRIGLAYINAGNSPKAMELLLQALRINEKINNLDGKARNLGNLGVVYANMGNYQRAIEYLSQTVKIFQQINEKSALTTTFSLIGGYYFAMAQDDSAMVYAQKAYARWKKSNSNDVSSALLLMGKVYLRTGETSLALDCFRGSIKQYKRARFVSGVGASYLGLSNLYDKEGRADSALYYANKAFAISYSLNRYTNSIDNVGTYLSGLYEKKGKADSAYFYLKLAKAAKDSVTSQQRLNQFQNLGFDEKLRQIELANTEQKAEEERQHNLQFAGLAVAILTFLILFFALSRTIIVKENFIKYFNVVVLLAVFEFINLLIHPYLARLTNDSPPLMLLILIGIGALLVPLHHKLEHWIAHALTEKNKQIRLAAAKKTIEHLEGGKND